MNMRQVTALYGSTAFSEPEAIGEAVTRFTEDVEDSIDVYQVTTTGDREAWSVEFTAHFPEGEVPQLEQAEMVDVV